MSHSLTDDVCRFPGICQCGGEPSTKDVEGQFAVYVRIPPCLAEVLRCPLSKAFGVTLGYRSVGRAEDVSRVAVGAGDTSQHLFGRSYQETGMLKRGWNAEVMQTLVGLTFID